jgi:hypothetical protein
VQLSRNVGGCLAISVLLLLLLLLCQRKKREGEQDKELKACTGR